MVKVDPSVLAGRSIFFADEIHSLIRRNVAFECYEIDEGHGDCHFWVLWIPSGQRGWAHHGGTTHEIDQQFFREIR